MNRYFGKFFGVSNVLHRKFVINYEIKSTLSGFNKSPPEAKVPIQPLRYFSLIKNEINFFNLNMYYFFIFGGDFLD